MKRYRVKVVGLGLALLAGELTAADGPPSAQPAGPGTSPALLPPALRAGDWVATGSGEVNALWLPARKPIGAQPAPAAVSLVPAATPVVVPSVAPPAAAPMVTPASDAGDPGAPGLGTAGPRLNPTASPLGPLPEIPAIPAPSGAPVPDSGGSAQPRTVTPADPQEWRPVPGTFAPPSPVVAGSSPAVTDPPSAGPRVIESPVVGPGVVVESPIGTEPVPGTMPPRPPADQLPPPRPVPPRDRSPDAGMRPPTPPAESSTRPALSAGYDLPVAPPELMTPAGVHVPGRRGTFGSLPISISRDYPSLRQLIGLGGHEGSWWGRPADSSDPESPPTDRFFARAEYLMWWVNPQRIPVLATTSVNGGFGFLGDPGTRALLGPGTFGDPLRLGMRLRAGWWFDDCGTCGVDGSFFFLGRQSSSATFSSGTFPTLTRPFFAPNFNAEFGEIVALPGFASGTLRVDATSTLWGFDANLRHALCRTCDYRAEVFAGYRFLGLDESLAITENITALPGNTNDPAGTAVVVQDRFQTRNRFNGGQVGLAAERNWGRLSLDGRVSVALGDTTQTVDITGSQARLRPGMITPDVFNGGLLATGPNLGHFTRDRFSVVPELAANLGYWVTPTVKAYFGYNFLYWSNVIRPGDQIDRVVDVTFVPNPPRGVPPSGQLRPQPTFRQSDLWVNGIQFGVEWRW
ncbi:MAG: hypothetical protein JWO38_8170 [Gemmataceae bacterium]|nr:hypothetical protein [Gemmataceae bacterium]